MRCLAVCQVGARWPNRWRTERYSTRDTPSDIQRRERRPFRRRGCPPCPRASRPFPGGKAHGPPPLGVQPVPRNLNLNRLPLPGEPQSFAVSAALEGKSIGPTERSHPSIPALGEIEPDPRGLNHVPCGGG